MYSLERNARVLRAFEQWAFTRAYAAQSFVLGTPLRFEQLEDRGATAWRVRRMLRVSEQPPALSPSDS
jgi:hypothetical protein